MAVLALLFFFIHFCFLSLSQVANDALHFDEQHLGIWFSMSEVLRGIHGNRPLHHSHLKFNVICVREYTLAPHLHFVLPSILTELQIEQMAPITFLVPFCDTRTRTSLKNKYRTISLCNLRSSNLQDDGSRIAVPLVPSSLASVSLGSISFLVF